MKKRIFTCVALAIALIFLAAAPEARARETITIKKANGGTYNVTAYNTANKTYYFLNGTLTSDSHGIIVPSGYGCAITVAMGRAVGNRNLYEHHDPLNPTFEAMKISTYLLELKYAGKSLSSSPSVQAVPGLPGPGSVDRMPPP